MAKFNNQQVLEILWEIWASLGPAAALQDAPYQYIMRVEEGHGLSTTGLNLANHFLDGFQ